MYSAQEIPQIDADLSRRRRGIAEKGHFWMKISCESKIVEAEKVLGALLRSMRG